jgi:spermidine synthase
VRDEGGVRTLLHGITNHGGQSLDPKDPFKPFGYYDSHSGLADVFALPYMNAANQPRKIAVIGLGTGAIACFFNREDRSFDYYEIDPAVVDVAQDPKYFTYLSDCVSHSTVQTGDGRLLIAHAPDHSYDVIELDAFTSDNIPLHIITKEAMQLYTQKLKPDGVLVFHVTNNFFDLETNWP